MKLGKIGKLVTNSYDKNGHIIHIRNLKQAINHGLVLKNIHRVITFNQKDLLKPYIDLNSELRQKEKNSLEKKIFKLMNNAVFEKTMENVRKYRYNKLVATEKRRNYLVSEFIIPQKSSQKID